MIERIKNIRTTIIAIFLFIAAIIVYRYDIDYGKLDEIILGLLGLMSLLSKDSLLKRMKNGSD